MTPPVRPEADPLEGLKALTAAQQPTADDPLEQLKALHPSAAEKRHADFRSGALARRAARENANDREQADAETPSYATQALGGIASLVKDIPGGEAAQAGARALVRRQSYRQALSDIQGAEADAPAIVRNTNRIAGGAVAASLMPGSPALSGARYGILSGLLQSDPDADAHGRLRSAVTRGAVGAAAGKLADVGITGLRGLFARSSGAASLARSAAMKEADHAAYGAAEREGAMPQPTPPAVAQALAHPSVAPFAQVIRDSEKFAGANDATVLREAFKLMSERQGTLANRAGATADFKAGTSLENADIGLAKNRLLNAADQIMPSFRPAVEQHAAMASNRDAFRTMTDAAGRAIRGAAIPAKKMDRMSQEAILEAIRKMKKSAADAGLEGTLGKLKESFHGSPNPLKLFGAGSYLGNAARVAPYVNALDAQANAFGGTLARGARAAAVASTNPVLAGLLTSLGLQ